MADNQRHRIKNLLQKLNDEDRNSLCCLLVKAGYAVSNVYQRRITACQR